MRALTEKGPKRQRAHKVYAKIANCLENSTMSVKIGPILEISAAPQSLQRDKIYGPGGAVPPVPADSPSLAKPPGPPVGLARALESLESSLWPRTLERALSDLERA